MTDEVLKPWSIFLCKAAGVWAQSRSLQRRHNQPLDLVVFVEDLHVVVFQPQIGVTQPANRNKKEIYWHKGFWVFDVVTWSKLLNSAVG